ncbi:MAG: nuclease-related domain-containing protein, partial [Anaeroplasmataceae bacterium]
RINRGTECDLIIITNKIYCVECKNYSTLIKGNSYGDDWTLISKGKRSKVANPYLSNVKHIRSIKGLLRKSNKTCYNIKNIVVVPDICRIDSDCSNVMHLSELLDTIEMDSYASTGLDSDKAFTDLKSIELNI